MSLERKKRCDAGTIIFISDKKRAAAAAAAAAVFTVIY
jgi:hypothetical protein